MRMQQLYICVAKLSLLFFVVHDDVFRSNENFLIENAVVLQQKNSIIRTESVFNTKKSFRREERNFQHLILFSYSSC